MAYRGILRWMKDMKKKKLAEEKLTVKEDKSEVLSFQDAFEHRLGLKRKPPGNEGDWLSPLPIGTYFLSGDKTSSDAFCHEYIVLDKTKDENGNVHSVQLLIHLPDRKIDRWCIPHRFCQIYFLQEIL